jgi:hypothetical protein
VLENESASTTFGPGSPAPYLSKTLRAKGAYVPDYFGTGRASNDNYIAMVSGQAPNVENQADCFIYNDFAFDTRSSYGQQVGPGCIYPTSVPSIASQLAAKRLTWRDCNDGMGADPKRESAECGHPAVNSRDGTQSATKTDQYATRHNPFVGSRAFRHDGGLLMIIFDEADTSDTRACCGEIPGPGSPRPGINGPGGGITGAVFLSPYIKPGTVTHYAYNHYTMLRSVEDLFGMPHIGYAQLPGERSFGSDIFTCPRTCSARHR